MPVAFVGNIASAVFALECKQAPSGLAFNNKEF